MNTYVCLKDKLYFRGRRFKKGDTYTEDGEPCDGKGKSLLTKTNPAFRLASGSVQADEPVRDEVAEIEDNDPRTNSQIRRDIKEAYGEVVDLRMKKINLLALEQKLKMEHGKDAALGIGTNDEMTLKEAEELVK